ncbi:MAG: tetratricopeptide repeat protein [Planctomycetia bacterium]|nr:tetratricopeptide repeat protein [Planctomycetia bacterium]
MKDATQRHLAATTVGMCIAAGALCFGHVDGDLTGLPVGPFGFRALVIVHLLAVWPIAWGIAELFVAGRRTNLVAGRISVAAGVALAAAVYTAGDSTWGAFNHDLPPSFVLAWLGREISALALMLPWCVAARCLFAGEADTAPNSAWTFLASGALVATAVPAVFADYHFRQQTTQLEQRLQEGRLAGLPMLSAQLEAAGSNQSVGGMSIDRLRDLLTEQIAAYRRALKEPFPADAAPDQVVQRAALMASLGEPDAAMTILAPLAANNASAAVLLGSVLDDMGRHDDAAQRFREAITLLKSGPAPNSAALRVQAFDSLAETLRDQHQYVAAEQTYFDAIKAAPAAEAHFRFQLGRHYALGGRSLAALESFERAAELSPEQYSLDRPEVQEQLRPLREGTPGCLLPSSYYYTNPKR